MTSLNKGIIGRLNKDMMYVLTNFGLIVRPPQCRFPTLPAWTGSLVFHSPFSWRTCDVMRSLSGTPVTSIVYRCEVGSWQFSQRSPSAPPRTIAVNTPTPPSTQSWDMEVMEIVEDSLELGEWQTSTREHSTVLASSLE